MLDDPLDDSKKEGSKEEALPPENPEETNPLERQRPQMPVMEEFPDKLGCPQCRRMFPVKSLRAKSNTLLTEAALVCPRCRRKLRRMKLKDWYDHYVQGQEKDFKMDSHGFVHTDPPGMGLNAPQEDQQDARDQRPPQGQNQGGPRDRRGGGPNRGRDPRQNQRGQQQQNRSQKKSILPQNPKAYRLPKKRRSR